MLIDRFERSINYWNGLVGRSEVTNRRSRKGAYHHESHDRTRYSRAVGLALRADLQPVLVGVCRHDVHRVISTGIS